MPNETVISKPPEETPTSSSSQDPITVRDALNKFMGAETEEAKAALSKAYENIQLG